MSVDLTKGTGRKSYIQRVIPRHFKAMDLLLAGHDTKTVADLIGMEERHLNRIQRAPLFQAEMARRRLEDKEVEILGLDRSATISKARSLLEQASVEAVDTQVEVMKFAENDGVRLKAAEGILDRVFGDTKSPASTVINISAANVALLNLALKESQSVNGKLPTNGPSANPQEGRSGDVHQSPSLERARK